MNEWMNEQQNMLSQPIFPIALWTKQGINHSFPFLENKNEAQESEMSSLSALRYQRHRPGEKPKSSDSQSSAMSSLLGAFPNTPRNEWSHEPAEVSQWCLQTPQAEGTPLLALDSLTGDTYRRTGIPASGFHHSLTHSFNKIFFHISWISATILCVCTVWGKINKVLASWILCFCRENRK